MPTTALFFASPPAPGSTSEPPEGSVKQSAGPGGVNANKSFNNNSFNTTTTVVQGEPAASVEVLRRVYAHFLTKTCDRVWGPRTTGQREKALRSVYARMFATEPVKRREDADQPESEAEGSPGKPVRTLSEYQPSDVSGNRTGILSIVAQHPRLAILGPPGGGKTTFLRHLALFRARCNSLEEDVAAAVAQEMTGLDPAEAKAWETLNGWVPVWIELRSLQPPKARLGVRPPAGLPWIFQAHLDALRAQPSVEAHEATPSGTRKDSPTWEVESRGLAVTWSGIVQRLAEAFQRGQVLFLLDGLDEVTRPGRGGRGALHQGIRELVQWTPFGGVEPAPNRVVVTCRERTWFDHWAIPGWSANLQGHVTTLDRFSPDDRRSFLRTWFRGREALAGEVARHLEDPRHDVGGRLSQMASVPLNLTMIAWLVEQREERRQADAGDERREPRGASTVDPDDSFRLPPSRAAIYEQVVDAILWEIDDRKDFPEPGGRTLSELIDPSLEARMKFVACLAGVAFEKLQGDENPLWREQDLLGPIAACLAEAEGESRATEDYRDRAALVLRTMQCRSGILRLEREDDEQAREYRFVHRSFLEYFAALHLVAYEGPRGLGTAEKARQWLQGRAQVRIMGVTVPGGEWLARNLGRRLGAAARWRKRERSWEPLRLAAGYVAVEEQDRPSASAHVPRGLVPGHDRRETAWVTQFVGWLLAAPWGRPHDLWLAGELAVEAGLQGATVPAGLAQALVTAMQSEALSEPERAAVGRVLGHLGDPRPGVAPGTEPGGGGAFFAWSKPISQGSKFIMGGDPHANGGGHGVHREIHQDYRIARYPVTNAQYDHFEDSKYFGLHARAMGWQKRDRSDARFLGKNLPVVNVQWTEAMGFCEWINSLKLTPAQLGLMGVGDEEDWVVRLPSEAEWEYAARGPEGRWLPWLKRENRDSSAPRARERDLVGRCNWWGNGIVGLSSVGLYPSGKSWCEAEDMIGNVWEWTRTAWRETPSRVDDGDNLEDSRDERRVLRGGSWVRRDPGNLRCATRFVDLPRISSHNLGFRVVCVRVLASVG